jgi:hypothetical protein
MQGAVKPCRGSGLRQLLPWSRSSTPLSLRFLLEGFLSLPTYVRCHSLIYHLAPVAVDAICRLATKRMRTVAVACAYCAVFRQKVRERR